MRHLTAEQLIAIRDGESGVPRADEHLATCTECQQALDASRWSLTLRPAPATRDEGEHPSQDELAAFIDNALSETRAQSVTWHMRSCDRCLALYSRLRDAEATLGSPSPPRKLLKAVQRKFLPRPVIQLGRLLLHRLGEVVTLRYLPEGGARSYGSAGHMPASVPRARLVDFDRTDNADLDPLATLPEPGMPHPSSAHARRRRLGGRRREQRTLATFSPPRVNEPPGPPVIEIADLRIELETVQEGDDVSLGMTLHRTDIAEPAHGLVIRLRPDAGSPLEAQTDADGRVQFPFPSGTSQLEIRGKHRLTFELDRSH